MPRSKSRGYPCVVSAALSSKLYSLMEEERQLRKISMSALVREKLLEVYGLQQEQKYVVYANEEEAAALVAAGYDLE